ncbi:MAG: beta-lactamase family protein [Chlorobi bacterium]|nr:beta-lactamase family protein [Chlorobiota bacterium]
MIDIASFSLTKVAGFLSILLAASLYSCNNSPTENEASYPVFEIEYNNNLPLDSFAAAIRQHYQLPGLAVATIDGDDITELAVVGKNKARDGILLDRKSKFQIASCTKSFTALLTATFVEEGIIGWETKVSDVFGNMKIHKDFRNITVRQLLTHTAGVQQFWTDEEVFNIRNVIPELKGNIPEKRKIFTQWNLCKQAPFAAGEHHYSNGGYVIVAALLEKLTGQPYEILMEKRVFRPLNLSSAEFGYPFLYDSSQPYRHMNRYENGTGITMDTQTRIPDPLFNPSGFISLTIEDFARYVRFHIRAIRGEETEINSDVVRALFKPEIKISDNNEIGMGWQIIYINGKKTYGHTGSDQTIRSAMSIDPESGKAVVFATNIGDPRSELAMINVIFELLDL